MSERASATAQAHPRARAHQHSHAPFHIPRWLRSPHVQTLGAALPLHTDHRLPTESLRFPIEGGTLHAVGHFHPHARRTCVLILHGVGGSSRSQYMLRAAHALFAHGHHVVRMDMRGAGDSLPDVPSLYHAGLVGDPDHVLSRLAARKDVRDVALVGVSLGGNVALKLAATWGSSPPIAVRAVAAISPPVDLLGASLAFESRRTLPYRLYVLRSLQRLAFEFLRLHPTNAPFRKHALKRMHTVRDYDDAVVAPMHGFRDALDYYVKSSAGPVLSRITVPTLVLHAEDDPMVPFATLRSALAGASHSVRAALTRVGGHVGWFGGLTADAFVQTWAMRQIGELLRA